MTQEDKELLLKDLCARLPYGVKCYSYCFKIDGNHCECYGTLDSIKLGAWYPFHLSNRMSINNGATYEETFSEVKPYLFPLSSMTGEQHKEFYSIFPNSMSFSYTTRNELVIYTDPEYDCDHAFESFIEMQDWLNAHHFDYRGLIEKGLAIDATGKNIY